MKPLHLTVLGSGSVGLTFAASCAKAGQQVTLRAREGVRPQPEPEPEAEPCA